MSFLVLPRKRIVQPQGFLQLSKNLGLTFAIKGGDAFYSLPNGIQPSFKSSGIDDTLNENGRTYLFDRASSERIDYLIPQVLTKYSFVAQVKGSGSHSYKNIFNSYNSSGNAGFQLREDSTNWDFYHQTSGGWTLLRASSAYTDAKTQTLVGVWNGSEIRLWINGIYHGSTSAASITNSTDSVRIGADAGASGAVAGGNWNGDISLFGLSSNSAWTDVQAQSISRRPYQIFEPQNRVVYFDFGGGSGSTLTGNNGTQTNTGGTGAVSTVYPLAGNNGTQTNNASTGAISVSFDLTGNNGTQTNTGSTGAISVSLDLSGNNGSQANEAGTGAIATTYPLTGNNGTQTNIGGTGAIIDGDPIIIFDVVGGGGGGPVAQKPKLKKESTVAEIVAQAFELVLGEKELPKAAQRHIKAEIVPTVRQSLEDHKQVEKALKIALEQSQKQLDDYFDELDEEEALIYLL